MVALVSQPGISSATVMYVPKEWDAKWFSDLTNNIMQGADVRNATGVGCKVSGNITTPYATITVGGATNPITAPVILNAGAGVVGLTINTTNGTDAIDVLAPVGIAATITAAGNGVSAANGAQFQYSTAGNLNLNLGGAIRLRIDNNGAVTIFKPTNATNAFSVSGFAGTAAIVSSAGAVGDHAIVVNGFTAGRSTINWAVNSASIAFTGVNNGAGDLIAGTTAQTFCIRTQGKDFAISTNSGGSSQLTVTAAGDTSIQGNVGFNNVGAQAASTGWGTPTGAATVTNFPGGGPATLAQCSNVIAQLITQLKRYGLFGA